MLSATLGFPISSRVQARVISHEYAARTRDTFAELVKRLNRQEISEVAARASKASVILFRCHDEAGRVPLGFVGAFGVAVSEFPELASDSC